MQIYKSIEYNMKILALMIEQSPASECQAIGYAKSQYELETRKQLERLYSLKNYWVLKLRRSNQGKDKSLSMLYIYWIA